MLKTLNSDFLDWEDTLSPVAYITVDFKKLVSDLFHAGSAMVGSESIKRKNEAIRIAPKHNNSLETFPYICNTERNT